MTDERMLEEERNTVYRRFVKVSTIGTISAGIVLLLMATRGTALQAYREPTGVVILIVGGVLSVVACQVMVRIGRLPEEQRVLR